MHTLIIIYERIYEMTRFITCAGYNFTGSSAITDLFSECDNVLAFGDYEYRFLQDPNGISDLEYNIVENNHRHNTSDAIKRFIKLMNEYKVMGYGGYDIFEDKYDICIQEYLNKIVELKTHSWWDKDRTNRGILFCNLDRLYSLIKRIINGDISTEKRYTVLSGREYGYFSNVSEDIFLNATKDFVNKLFSSVNIQNKPYIMVDQLLPPSNTRRFLRYVEDIRLIIVDRDPRDLYIGEKELWKWGVMPTDTVDDFISWFRITRGGALKQPDELERVLRINFEELIYEYDNTVNKLLKFVGMDSKQHSCPKTIFDPNKSINNTCLMNKYDSYNEDIKKIESELKEYLFDFKKYTK